MMSLRTLRCANGLLYLCMGVAVACCAAWAIGSGRVAEAWQISAAVVASVVCMLWGGYYSALRWEISPEGICRRLLWWQESYSWNQLESAEIAESSSNGVASCCILLHFPGVKLCISSELFSLDDVEKVRDELKNAGLLASK